MRYLARSLASLACAKHVKIVFSGQTRMWNVLNTETGLMMMCVSTTHQLIARDTALRYARLYPGYHFTVTATGILNYPPHSEPKRVMFPARGAANDNGRTS